MFSLLILYVFLFCMFCFLFCVFGVVCIARLIVPPLVYSGFFSVYKFTDHCHRMETQLQSINISYNNEFILYEQPMCLLELSLNQRTLSTVLTVI
jgi:hypothetical protein